MREVSVVFKPWDREAAIPQGMTVVEAASKPAFEGGRIRCGVKAARGIAERLPEEVQYHELLMDPEFKKEFIAAMFLPHREPVRFPTA